MKREADRGVIEKLQQQILTLQGSLRPADLQTASLQLGPLEKAFPGKVFPRGAVHDFISDTLESAASTNGFISVMLGRLMQKEGTSLWIGSRRRIFPPALKSFGVEPHRVLFIETWRTKDALWAMEEALKCEALSAVVGEIAELSFNDSRRLQLAVERSRVTAILHRYRPRVGNIISCVSRFQISALASVNPGNMPGLGFPAWNIRLLKVRNGTPGEWQAQYLPQGLQFIDRSQVSAAPEITLQAG